MARHNQETITTFGEVLHSSNISYSQNRSSSNDNRLMIYFQGMKVYIPDNFQPDCEAANCQRRKLHDKIGSFPFLTAQLI